MKLWIILIIIILVILAVIISELSSVASLFLHSLRFVVLWSNLVTRGDNVLVTDNHVSLYGVVLLSFTSLTRCSH